VARRARPDVQVGEDHDAVIAWYQERLAEPAVFPWAGGEWEPVRLGPSWMTANGRWVLPDASIGWDVLGFAGTEMQLRNRPWRYTLEQARFVLWWYAVDESGRWLFDDGVLQRLKGWGKDPVAATLCGVEAFGPCRFAGWDGDHPVATDKPAAWVQSAATSLTQTKNTMRLFPSLWTPDARDRFRMQILKETVHGLGDDRLIEAVTSSPATLEGGRPTFVQKNETQHWLANNSGHDMADVIERNATKAEDGAARSLAITNAFDPAEDSVAQRDREAWELAQAGATVAPSRTMYDSLEAPHDAPLTAEAAAGVVAAVRGDSVWLDPDRIVRSILDPRNPPSRSRRFWYNQVTAAEDAWVDLADFDPLADASVVVSDADDVVLFFDGSKSDDATALVACRMSDGHVMTVGLWQRPPKERGVGWTAPRASVDALVCEVFDRYQVVGFWADPSHTTDDESGERYWDGLIDEWHRRWRDRLQLWAQPGKHSIMWDMSSPAHTAEFTAAAERCVSEIEFASKAVGNGLAPSFTWDGDSRLRIHVRNARRFPNRYGVSLWKGHRESPNKVDLAVCMVGARMLRRNVLNSAPARPRSGRVW
jgi:hypothetical protein